MCPCPSRKERHQTKTDRCGHRVLWLVLVLATCRPLFPPSSPDWSGAPQRLLQSLRPPLRRFRRSCCLQRVLSPSRNRESSRVHVLSRKYWRALCHGGRFLRNELHQEHPQSRFPTTTRFPVPWGGSQSGASGSN